MSRPANLFKWAITDRSDGGRPNVIEPPSDYQDFGYYRQEDLPVRQFFNWIGRQLSLWVEYLDASVTSIFAKDAAQDVLIAKHETSLYDSTSGVVPRVAALESRMSIVENPIGAVTAYAGSAAPSGWLLCDGTSFAKTDYPTLFALLSPTMIVPADPSATTCPTPDLKGRFVVGVGLRDGGRTYELNKTVDTLGEEGEEAHTLTVDEMPSHDHNLTACQLQNTTESWVGNDHKVYSENNFDTSATGGDLAHENRPPFYALTYIIRAK